MQRGWLAATWAGLVVAACGPGCSTGGDSSHPPPATSGDASTTTRIGCEGCVSLTGGLVFDGTRADRGSVVLRGTQVEQVAFGEVEVVAGEVVELDGHTVLPGLFNLHVHSNGESGPYAYFSIENLMEPNLKARLRAGLLSYLDLGSLKHIIFEMRSRLRAGKLLGPNLFAAGPLLTPHEGHPCYAGTPPHDFCAFIDQKEDVSVELAALLPDEPDVIKIVIEAGTPNRPMPRLSKESIDALGAAAQAQGLKMIAHVSEIEDMKLALDAGIRLFAHIPTDDLIDHALAQRLAQEQAVIVPTLAVMDSLYRIAVGQLTELDDPTIADDVPAGVIAAFKDPQLLGFMISPEAQKLYGDWHSMAFENFRTCIAAGVQIAAGTDAGNPGVFHGRSIWRELALYVENGMTPVEALVAGTRGAADVLGRSDLGRLEPGAVADVVVVEGDATADISNLTRVQRVYRAGRLLDRDALSLQKQTSLVEEPTDSVAEGGTCLAPSECGPDLYCDWFSSCSAECGASVSCDTGDACFPQDDTNEGWCYPGDGCSLLAQDCENGQACIWLGNAATICWSAGTSLAGEPCDELGACAPGNQCNPSNNRCAQLCDPASTGGCPANQACVDKTSQAGLPIGECL